MKRFEDVFNAGHRPWSGGYLYMASVFRKHPIGLWRAYDEARRAQGALWKAGVNVFSPIACFYSTAVWEEIDQTDHDWWMRHDFPYMRGSRGIIILQQDGWEESEGIQEERKFFSLRNNLEYSLDYPVQLDEKSDV